MFLISFTLLEVFIILEKSDLTHSLSGFLCFLHWRRMLKKNMGMGFLVFSFFFFTVRTSESGYLKSHLDLVEERN